MAQRGFYIELDRCVGCHSCEVACKQWNGLAPNAVGKAGPNWRTLTSVESGVFPNVTAVELSLACMHCGAPACEAVCPAGAIAKRPDDGIVVVDQEKCIGCHYCFFACPFGVPQYGDDGTMEKCNLCLDRLEQGKEPICVATCPTQALHSGTLEELGKMAAEKAARKLAASTQPSLLVTP